MATGTWGSVATAADKINYKMHMVDASGDTWVEDLYVAIAATAAAIQAWIILYQTATQASIYQVTREEIWAGAKDSGNADFNARFEVKNGVNLSFRDSVTDELVSLRVVAPVLGDMQGETDIPVPNVAPLSDLIIALPGISPNEVFQTAQYTIHRERKGNPKIS